MVLFSALVLTAEPVAVTIQGKIMDWDLKKNMIVVNEKYFFWNSQTLFYVGKGNAIKASQFKVKRLKMNTLVKIEAVKKTSGRKQFTIKKLYLP
jgi:ribosomal protein S17